MEAEGELRPLWKGSTVRQIRRCSDRLRQRRSLPIETAGHGLPSGSALAGNRLGRSNMLRQSRSTPAPDNKPVKICFERIIPDELDTERRLRHVVRDSLIANAGRELNADETVHLARMAVIATK